MRAFMLSLLIRALVSQTFTYAQFAGSDTTQDYKADLSLDPRSDSDDLQEWLANIQRSSKLQKACPISCTTSNDQDGGWFLYPDKMELSKCNETMLVDVMLDSDFDGTGPRGIRACKAEYTDTVSVQRAYKADDQGITAPCDTPNHALTEVSVRMWQPEDAQGSLNGNHAISAGHQVSRHLSVREPSCSRNALAIGYYQSSVVGVFGGAQVHQHGVTMDVLGQLLQHAEQNSLAKTTVVEVCPKDTAADYHIGIVVSPSERLSFVQQTLKTWSNGKCISEKSSHDMMTVTLRLPSLVDTDKNETIGGQQNNQIEYSGLSPKSRIIPRGTCKTTKVIKGDGCWAVAKRCGISQADLTKYNPAKNFCSTLAVDQVVCCSAGTLPSTIPSGNADGTCKTKAVQSGDSCGSMAKKCGLTPNDFMKVNTKKDLCSTLVVGQPVCCTKGKYPDIKPKPNSDGSCATYKTKKDDGCGAIAAARGLTVKDIEGFNKKTWGWLGCKKLFPDYNMCVSTGAPPMPASVSNAECGPTVPGTKKPKAGTDLASLNPCPLNACCNTWGHCGLSEDFCIVSKSETGAPGTAAPGKVGCISHCGMELKKGPAPDHKMRIAYFESWNGNRDCLHMQVNDIDTSFYTHIHFAFANITSDFRVDISDKGAKEQFSRFKAMKGVKKVISFGGWDFSALPGTYHILRDAVKPANREKFTNNIVSFVKSNGFDGVDIDWEYPGAPDIPDIPSGDPVEGMNYYETLSLLKKALGSSKTVSFAAPSSFWYLKAFPVEKMAKVIDYIVHMTYDLHGQWDYNNKWTSSGCPTGNCLRSHVNQTETISSLVMITKAGVPTNKIAVGVASYGRSFKMEKAGCTGVMCKFTGSPRVSNARQGHCTKTAGYISNAEIDEIIQGGKYDKKWTGEGSSYLVYNQTEWVGYMSEDDKQARYKLYDGYNFLGTSDWAVDLQRYTDGTNDPGVDWDDIDVDVPSCKGRYTSLDQLEKASSSLDPYCVQQYLVSVQIKIMEDAIKDYKNLLDKGYNDKFNYYSDYVRGQVPEQIDRFMYSGKADKYFTCIGEYSGTCCNQCQWGGCLDGCIKGDGCDDGHVKEEVKCPDTLKYEVGTLPLHYTLMSATYKLKDADGFWKDIGNEYGIDESWVTFGDVDAYPGASCQFAGKDIRECQKENDYWFYNYPERKDDMQVYNPKNVIGKSYDKTLDLISRVKIMQSNMDVSDGLVWVDLIDSTTMPALSLASAVDNMNAIVKTVADIKKAEREEFIVNFITGLLFFIPFAGEAAGAAGLTAARSMLRLVGEAGDLGLLTYGIVEDPKSAFMGIFSYLSSAGVAREGFHKAAQSRRSMSSKERDSLGKDMKAKMDRINKLKGSCSA